jgi:hypothetical protein
MAVWPLNAPKQPDLFLPDDLRSEFAAYIEEFEELRSGDAERIGRYRQYRDEFDVARDSTVWDTAGDYGRRRDRSDEPQRHKISLPFGSAMTVKHAYRISGRMPDIIVDRRAESAEERYRSDTVEKILWGITRESKGDQQFSTVAWDGSQLGAGAFDLRFSPTKNMPIYRAIDPIGLFVVRGIEDPHDFERAYYYWNVSKRSLIARYGNIEFRETGQSFANFANMQKSSSLGEDMVTVVDMSTRWKKTRFVLEGGIPLEEIEHNYGFVPYVVTTNLGPERDVWGLADYEFYRALCSYIPVLFSRQADVIKMASGGAYQDKKTGQSVSFIRQILERGGVLPTRETGSLEPVPPPEIPDFLPLHQEQAVTFLKMLGFAPDAAWGAGTSTSGADRNQQLGPLLEFTGLKQINYGSAFSRLFERCLRMVESHTVGQVTYAGMATKGTARSPFAITLGAAETGLEADVDPEDPTYLLNVPKNPAELVGGDYFVRCTWANRIDPDDPAFVTSEVNKFAQGCQSLYTTLERLGVVSPNDELRLITEEADKYPWLRQGMIAMIKANLGAGGDQGGDTSAPGMTPEMEMMMGGGGGDGGALDLDAMNSALPGDSPGVPYGGA